MIQLENFYTHKFCCFILLIDVLLFLLVLYIQGKDPILFFFQIFK